MTTLNALKKELLADPGTRAECAAMAGEFELARELVSNWQGTLWDLSERPDLGS